MKFGIHNPSWRFGTEPAGIFDAVKAKAQWAEDHGFTWFSVMDHLIQIAMAGPPEEPFMEGWTILSALAAVTKRIRLATLVSSVHYRNPAHLAKIAAGVDQISRGRLTFGIGAGWFEAEYKQYGWDFPPKPATRIAQMEEAVRLILSMWTEKRTTFHGKYFHAENAILEPKPVQKPHPPLMIGGGGEQLTLRAVARYANACNVGGTPDQVRHKFEVLRRHCETQKRNYDEIERTNVIGFVLARDEAALAAKRQRLEVPAQFMGFAGTVAQAADLIGKYKDAGSQLLISSAWRNDAETLEVGRRRCGGSARRSTMLDLDNCFGAAGVRRSSKVMNEKPARPLEQEQCSVGTAAITIVVAFATGVLTASTTCAVTATRGKAISSAVSCVTESEWTLKP